MKSENKLVRDIKDKINIVDVVELLNIQLTKRGNNYVALCPLHNEKTASFTIFPNTNTYKCFGCNKGGDVISLVQEVLKISFIEACHWLALKFNIELPDSSNKQSTEQIELEQKKESIFLANKFACEFYQSALNQKANSFLEQKKITPASRKDFLIGYAPPGNLLRKAALDAGFTDEILLLAGLIARNENGEYYDVFRDRINYPIVDKNERVVGFSGRVLDESKPKYINTKQTIAYEKGNVLYGLNKALPCIRKKKEVHIVEGITDMISCHQSGVENTVALCGTALTQNHVSILKPIAKKVVLMLDSDEAGKRATLKALDIMLAAGLEVTLVDLPENADPNDLVIAGTPLNEYIQTNKKDAILSIMEKEMTKEKSPTEVAAILKTTANLIAKIPDETCAESYINKITKQYKISKKQFRKQVNAHKESTEDEIEKEITFDTKKHRHIKVLDTYHAITLKRFLNDPTTYTLELTPRKASELAREYGAKYLLKIPRFDGIISKPNHFNHEYTKIIKFEGNIYKYLNWYYKLPYPIQPFELFAGWDEGKGYDSEKFPQIQNTLKFFMHIGGEYLIQLLDYCSILLKHPERHLPALCLVSIEKETGKTTFMNLLRAIFGENVAYADARRFSSNFNKFLLGKLLVLVEETHDEKGEIQETIKNYITGSEIQIEGKGQDAFTISSFMKLVFCSNHPETFLRGGDDDRFFVLEISSKKNFEKDNKLLDKMIAEIPYFLHFLNVRKIRTADSGRLWFRRIETPALLRLQEASQPVTIRSLKELLLRVFSNKLKAENGTYVPSIKLSSKQISTYLNKYNNTNQFKPYLVTQLLKSHGYKQSTSTTTFNYPLFDPGNLGHLEIKWDKESNRYFKFMVCDFLTIKDVRSLGDDMFLNTIYPNHLESQLDLDLE